jgi:uncharacterized protein YqhQ
MAGIHAAEHMTVNAIERGEELLPQVVQRMPRVHPRCGTNIAVAAIVFLGLMGQSWIKDSELRLLLAALVTLVIWQPLGTFLQLFITTKPPSSKQLAMGVRAGRELLDRYAVSPYATPNVGTRLLNSGLFHIMLGSFLASGFVWVVSQLLNLPPGWRVF